MEKIVKKPEAMRFTLGGTYSKDVSGDSFTEERTFFALVSWARSNFCGDPPTKQNVLGFRKLPAQLMEYMENVIDQFSYHFAKLQYDAICE